MENKTPGTATGVMIKKGNQILLGKRYEDPVKMSKGLHGPGAWTMPGGKLELYESLEECAKRETFEESGIMLNSLKIISINDDILNNDAHFVTVGFYSD